MCGELSFVAVWGFISISAMAMVAMYVIYNLVMSEGEEVDEYE